MCEVEKHKGAKEPATKFDVWNGLRDLSFIIPRNFSNLSQKSGGRQAGATTATINGKRYDDEDGGKGDKKKETQGFVGLKSPDHLKKVCNMFRNSEYKS